MKLYIPFAINSIDNINCIIAKTFLPSIRYVKAVKNQTTAPINQQIGAIYFFTQNISL